jgi:hypothetical protein
MQKYPREKTIKNLISISNQSYHMKRFRTPYNPEFGDAFKIPYLHMLNKFARTPHDYLYL